MSFAALQDFVTNAAGIEADGYPLEDTPPPEDTGAEQTAMGNLATLLERRRFQPRIEPPPLRPIYTLAGSVICTPGNLTSITSAIKTGKSAVVSSMAASVLGAGFSGDFLGFKSSNPSGFALLHFDSEQSPDDHWHLIARALKRAGLNEPPPWFYSYRLTGLCSRQAWDCVAHATEAAAQVHGGVHSCLIDGVADLVADVNDPGASNAFVSTLHDMAIRYDCPIAGVIHFNPGGEKTRGHLGSQLERKAETNLRLDKQDGVTTIWSDKQRRAPIPKDTGPCFQWNDEAGMHVSVESRSQAKADIRLEDARMKVAEAFRLADRPVLHYLELIAALQRVPGVKSTGTAERIFRHSKTARHINKNLIGQWQITP